MSIRFKRKSNTMTISSLNEGRILKKFNMTPEYQRKSVWSDEQQSLLIDSIIKNIPIPPIFLRENIDKKGKTTFEVIDGKQRLTSIFRFIDNEIPTTDDDADPLYHDEIAGLNFSELDADDKFEEVLEEFWRYPIPIEYVYTKNDKAVDKIFDRLNRSGEKLNGQELRHATYYDSELLIMATKFAKSKFWEKELEITNRNRMEDIELVSEFIFLLIEKKELSSSPKLIDALYHKHARSQNVNWVELEREFEDVTSIFESFDLNLADYGVSGVSHLYGVWAFAFECYLQQKTGGIKKKIHDFYRSYKIGSYGSSTPLASYKQSMMYSTKGDSQRRKRKRALVDYCFK